MLRDYYQKLDCEIIRVGEYYDNNVYTMLIRLNDAMNSLFNRNCIPRKQFDVNSELQINGICKIENFLDPKYHESIGAWIRADTINGYLTGSDWRIDNAEKYNMEIKNNVFDN